MLIAHTKLAGILLALAGGALIFIAEHFNFKPFWIGYAAYGLIIAGGVTFITGLVNALVFQAQGEKSLHVQDGAVAATALIRCMIAVSIADGHLDDREVRAIVKIYRSLMKSDIGEETIRVTAEHMKAEGADLETEIGYVRTTLYKGLRRKILHASLYILAADGHIDAREEEVLEIIRQGFRISRADYRRMKGRFLEARLTRNKT